MDMHLGCLLQLAVLISHTLTSFDMLFEGNFFERKSVRDKLGNSVNQKLVKILTPKNRVITL